MKVEVFRKNQNEFVPISEIDVSKGPVLCEDSYGQFYLVFSDPGFSGYGVNLKTARTIVNGNKYVIITDSEIKLSNG